jgi:hypothetical protein
MSRGECAGWDEGHNQDGVALGIHRKELEILSWWQGWALGRNLLPSLAAVSILAEAAHHLELDAAQQEVDAYPANAFENLSSMAETFPLICSYNQR